MGKLHLLFKVVGIAVLRMNAYVIIFMFAEL